jgi:tetratricopeptide (TPR) repeat protein
MTTGFRKRVGESGATLEKYDVPLAEATTASIDALQAYSLGLHAVETQSEDASIPYFKRAIELDPKFAMAYAWLALLYGSSGSSELATENARKAYQFGFVYPALTNYPGAIQQGHRLLELAPEVGNYYFLLGVNFLYAGRLSESEETLAGAYARKIQNPKLLMLQYDLAFLRVIARACSKL